MKKYAKSLTVVKITTLVMALAVVLLIVSISMAAGGGGGDTPAEAVTLDAEVNQGKLQPLEQHWFKFVADPEGRDIDIEKTLTLIYTPNQPFTAQYINLRIYEENQIALFDNGDVTAMAHMGAGSPIERDSNPETGEQVWTGWVYGPKTYYIMLANNSDFPIDYYFFNADVKQAELGAIEPPPEADQPEAAESDEPYYEITEAGIDPLSPAELSADGVTHGKLSANESGWYTFEFPDPDNQRSIKEVEYTLFYTPMDGNLRHLVNFELFRAGEADFWARGDGAEGMTNFGAGAIVERDRNYLTGERLWSGAVLNGDTYLLSVKNDTGIEIDYWLVEGDVYDFELEGPTFAATKVYAPGAAPTTSLPLVLGENVGKLMPGEQAWHSFFITDFDNEAFEQMALTMVATPADGNRDHYVTFEVFRAGPDVQYWSETDLDNTQINNMGAGSLVVRDDNPWTMERFWNGWVLDNNLYLVQVRNGSDVPIDYHLFTGDVYRPPLGEEEAPQVEITADPGEARETAFDLALGVNRGQLDPGEETWYRFTRADVGAAGDETNFTMVFTPNDGNRVYNVALDLYSGAERNRFGSGQVVERDNDVTTGELLWNGQVRPNEVYYMRVGNDSDTRINYWIFPDDVINANLD